MLEAVREVAGVEGVAVVQAGSPSLSGVASSGALVVETRDGVRQVRSGTVELVEGVA